MNRLKTIALLMILMASGCVSPGNDPVVVNAERTTQLAADVFDTFLLWERENREALRSIPEIKKSADFIRARGVTWLETARSMTKAYKHSRTPENRANLDTALAVLRQAVTEVRTYMAQGPPSASIQEPQWHGGTFHIEGGYPTITLPTWPYSNLPYSNLVQTLEWRY